MPPDRDLATSRRELRLRIARLRRRIDRRVRAVAAEGRRLASYRTYVRRHPGRAVLAALGIGVAAGLAVPGRRWPRHLGLRLLRRSAEKLVADLGVELGGLWADLVTGRRRESSDKPAETSGGENGRT